jgi:hypothetical protein
MVQWLARSQLTTDDWTRLLAILGVAAVVIVVIWLSQRQTAKDQFEYRQSPSRRDPFAATAALERARAAASAAGITPAPSASSPPSGADDFDQFVAKQREQERIIQQRGVHHYLFAH